MAFHLEEGELDGILVEQKNRIIRLIDSGEVSAARAAIDVVEMLWIASSYGYKVKELEQRLSRKIAEMLDN